MVSVSNISSRLVTRKSGGSGAWLINADGLRMNGRYGLPVSRLSEITSLRNDKSPLRLVSSIMEIHAAAWKEMPEGTIPKVCCSVVLASIASA